MDDFEAVSFEFTLACPLREGEWLYDLRLEATCQTMNQKTAAPRSEKFGVYDVVMVPEPANGLIFAALFLALLATRRNRR